MLTQVERIAKKIILAAGLRPELTFTSFGRHGGATESSTSGLTETQLMKKGQWSSTKAMPRYLHDDDEAKRDAQIKRIKRRAKPRIITIASTMPVAAETKLWTVRPHICVR